MTSEPDTDDLGPADLLGCEGERLLYFRAGIDAARAEMARGEGIAHEQVQREMDDLINGLIADESAARVGREICKRFGDTPTGTR